MCLTVSLKCLTSPSVILESVYHVPVTQSYYAQSSMLSDLALLQASGSSSRRWSCMNSIMPCQLSSYNNHMSSLNLIYYCVSDLVILVDSCFTILCQ